MLYPANPTHFTLRISKCLMSVFLQLPTNPYEYSKVNNEKIDVSNWFPLNWYDPVFSIFHCLEPNLVCQIIENLHLHNNFLWWNYTGFQSFQPVIYCLESHRTNSYFATWVAWQQQTKVRALAGNIMILRPKCNWMSVCHFLNHLVVIEISRLIILSRQCCVFVFHRFWMMCRFIFLDIHNGITSGKNSQPVNWRLIF